MELRRQDFFRKLRKHGKNNEELKGGDVYSNSMILKLLSSDGKEWNEVIAEKRKAFEEAWNERKTLMPCPEFVDPWIFEAAEFMKIIAFKIASQTSLKYDIKRIYRPELIIPLDILKDEDKTSTEELVKQKVNTLKTFLETEIDLSRCDQREKHKLSIIDFENYKLEIHTKFGVTPVKLKRQNIKRMEVKSVQINNSKPSSVPCIMKGGGIWNLESDEAKSLNEETSDENLSIQTSEQTDLSSMEEEYDETSSSIKPIDEIIEENETSIDEVQSMTGGTSKPKDKPKPTSNKIKKAPKPLSDEVVEIQVPYIRDGAIIIDFSRPFEEMGFMFNGLHIFEHLMCTPWVHMKKFSMENLVCLNGFTTNLGLMYIYTVHNSKASFQVYLDEMISWLNKIRTPGFWHEHMKDEDVQMEIERTISETIDVQWMVDFARSSGSAFEGNYREDVFEYWSNQPLKMTLIHPYQDVFIPHLDSPRHVQKPSIPTFDYLPMQVLTTQSLVTYKKSSRKELTEQVCDALMYGLVLKGDTGVDIQRLNGDGSYFEISLLSTYREDVKNFKDVLKLIMLFESSTLGLFEPIYPDEWI